MNIENILSFVYVYQYKNFHKAANTLFVTQPSLSSRIKTLEKELNTRLITRGKSGVELTPDGEIFLPYALQIINTYTSAQNALNKGKETIVIGTNVSVSISIFPYVFRVFHQRHPNVSIQLVTGLTEDLLGRLRAGECDFLVTQQIDAEEVEMVTVYRDPIHLVVPQEHPFLLRDQPPTFAEVSLEPLIRNWTLDRYWQGIEAHFRTLGAEPNIILNVDSLEITKTMILQKIGISFLPLLALETELLNKALFVVQPTPPIHVERQIDLIHLTGRPPKYRDSFIDLFQRYR